MSSANRKGVAVEMDVSSALGIYYYYYHSYYVSYYCFRTMRGCDTNKYDGLLWF